jgi:hypothetical protein
LATDDTFAVEPGQRLALELSVLNVYLAPRSYAVGFSIGQNGVHRQRVDYDIVAGPLMNLQVVPPDNGGATLANWGAGWGDIVLHDNSLRRV